MKTWSHLLLGEGATGASTCTIPEVNASVAPGGHIREHRLIRACGRTTDDWRSAHEMGHRIARHVAEHASIEMLRTIGVAWGRWRRCSGRISAARRRRRR